MWRKCLWPLLWIVVGGALALIIENLLKSAECDVGAVEVLVAVIGVAVSAITHYDSVDRARKLDTLNKFSAIREKFPNVNPKAKNPVDDDVRTEYLNVMERFCTGIEENLYDIGVIRKTSGRMLVKQYKDYMGSFVAAKRGKSKTIPPEDLYCQYEAVIKKLKEKCE